MSHKFNILILLLCLLAGSVSTAVATTFTIGPGDLPITLDASYRDDTIKFSGDVSTSSNGIFVATSRVTILGEGNTIFFGTGGGTRTYGIRVNFSSDSLFVRDLNLVHDPDGDGDAEDTANPATQAIAIDIGRTGSDGGPHTFEIRNCSLVVYGDNGQCIESTGGVGMRNLTMDSVHMWNYCYTFTSRHSYDGAAARLAIRGSSIDPPEFAGHIYRSVVHIAPQIGFACFGSSSSDVSNRSDGWDIAYCSTFVDHHTSGNQNANQYGFVFRFCGAPFSFHDNYVGAGTKYGGSRGIILESTVGKVDDSIKVYNNTIKVWTGPDLENSQGITRGMRIRDLDGGWWDYLYIHDNWVEVVIDNDAGTDHIGLLGFAMNLSVDDGTAGYAHALIENNTFVLRSLDATGPFGAAGHYGIDSSFGYGLVPPMTIRNNRYISSDKIVYFADHYNWYSANGLTSFGDTLGFLPAGDSGVNVNTKLTWQIGKRAVSDSSYGTIPFDMHAVNAFYRDGASDTNIYLVDDTTVWQDPGYPLWPPESTMVPEFDLTQRIPINVTGASTFDLKIVNNFGQTVLDTTGFTSGDSTNFRYWKTYGEGYGSDSNYNTFDIIVTNAGAADTVQDTTIDWQVTSLDMELPYVWDSVSYYVDTAGNASWSGHFSDSAWPMIKACTTTIIVPGNTIYIKPGIYDVGWDNFEGSEKYILAPRQSGTAVNRITWRNVPGSARPELWGDSLQFEDGINLAYCPYTIFDSIRVVLAKRRGVQMEGARNIIIRNCVFDSCGIHDSPGNNSGAISAPVGQADSLEIYNNAFFNNESGIHFECGIDSTAIYNNTFTDCGYAGVTFKVSIAGKRALDAHVYNNTFIATIPSMMESAVNIWGAYVMRNIFIHHNVMIGPFSDAAIRFPHTDQYADTMRHDNIYIYNNTVDCGNRAGGFLMINQADTVNSDVSEQYQFLFDTVHIFNNIAVNPEDAGSQGSQYRGLVSFSGYMSYVNNAQTPGVGRVGPGFLWDYNAIVDTGGPHVLFRWFQARKSGASWAQSPFTLWTHQQWLDSMPITPFEVAADFMGRGLNDTLIYTVSNLFVDAAGGDYRLHANAPNYLKTGGKGGTVHNSYGNTMAVPTYIGAFAPTDAVCDTGSGNTFYVDGTNGNDSWHGKCLDSAWRTVQRACDAPVTSGDTVLIRSGIYGYGGVGDSAHGAIGGGYFFVMEPPSGTTYKGYPGDTRPRIRGDSLKPRANGEYLSCIGLYATSGVVLDSLEMVLGMRHGAHVEGASNFTIKNCVIDSIAFNEIAGSNPSGIGFGAGGGGNNVTITNNEFFDNNTGGIELYGVDDLTITDNTFSTSHVGIFLKISGGVRDSLAEISGNTIIGGGTGRLVVKRAMDLNLAYTFKDAYIHHNLVYGAMTDGYAITVDGTSDGLGYDWHVRRVYVYNNTIDVPNMAHAGFRHMMSDTTSSGVFRVDSLYFFNNIVHTAKTTSSEGVFNQWGRMTYVGSGVTNGVGRLGKEFMWDYNGLVDTTTNGPMFRWHEGHHNGSNWVAGTLRYWTLQEFRDSLPLYGADYAGHGANDVWVDSTTSIFVDKGSADYQLNVSAPQEFKTGGRGGSWPTYFGAFDPGVEPPSPPAIQIRRRRSPSYQLGAILELDKEKSLNDLSEERGSEIFSKYIESESFVR